MGGKLIDAKGLIIGGHPSVTQALVSGLKKIDINFSLNNYRRIRSADLVIVLSGTRVLSELISMKKKGLVYKLWAGPNISVLPSDNNYLLCDKCIDTILTPSEWVKKKYCKINPSLNKKILVWPSGTNLKLYPVEKIQANRSNILIYHKYREINNFLQSIIDEIRNHSFKRKISTTDIFYGNYKSKDYIYQLSSSFLCFYLSDRPESQGLALQESWSMNVPTAVLSQDVFSYYDFTAPASSAPYITDYTGVIFHEIIEISKIIDSYFTSRKKIVSRAWVEQHLTDSLTAQKLMAHYRKEN